MPLELSWLGTLWLMLAAFAAAFVRGYGGFGFAAVLISAAALVTNPLRLVAVALLADLVLSVQLWRGISGLIDWRRVLLLFVGALVGLPVGLALLTQLSELTIRLIVSGWVLGMGVLLISGWMLRATGQWVPLLAGTISGAANAAGVGGLPVVALLAAQPIPAKIFRATLIAYFLLLDLWTLPLLWLYGLFESETVYTVLFLAPALVIGTWAGSRRFSTAAPESVRRFTVWAIVILAAVGVVRATHAAFSS